MSPRYENEVMELSEWFQVKLLALPPLALTETQFKRGTDELPDPYAALTKEAFEQWLRERNYELSHNQVCRGFFGAIRAMNKLTITI